MDQQKDTPDLKINYIPTRSTISWDHYFMLQAMISAFKSKDPATKVGCVIVDENNHHISMGYNGFVAGIDETKLPWGKDTSVPLEYQKYGYVVHSEANAIMHANRNLQNCKAYVTLFPCNECAKLLASKKIQEVVYLSDKHSNKESVRMAKKLLTLSNIKFRQLDMGFDVMENLHHHLNSLMTDL